MFPLRWKRRSWLESSIFCDRWHVCMLVLFSLDPQTFPSHWKKRSWLGVLTFEVEGMFICLFSSLGIFNLHSSLLEEKALILKSFLLDRESLIWGRVFHFGVILLLLRNDCFSLVGILEGVFHLGVTLLLLSNDSLSLVGILGGVLVGALKWRG